MSPSPEHDPLALAEDERAALVERLAQGTREAVAALGRRGIVVGVSGGVDSGVVAALSVRALGPKRVLCLRMPEKDIGGNASDLGLEVAEALGAETREEPITAALEGLGFYRRRDEAIRPAFEDYEPDRRH